MKYTLGTFAVVMIFISARDAHAVLTATSTRGLAATDLDGMLSTTDAIAGLIATELPGDTGWHPVNPAANDSLHPNGLPAFTDGQGGVNVFTGLLNDFPEPRGVPVKLIQYDLAQPIDLERIHILSGNINNADGRIFSTTAIRYSTDGGQNFTPLGYFESAPLGSINNESGDLGTTMDHALLLEIFDDAGGDLASAVTNLQFDFFSVDNTGGQYRDPFDGVNPFTELDDGLSSAFVSPLIWEIDVIGQPVAGDTADFDSDADVDGADLLAWQRGFGVTGSATRAMGDANQDQAVNALDLDVWKQQFGAAVAAVPEPATLGGVLVAASLACVGVRRR
ncbi:MAG: hypothetical protein DCC67_20570 [Planctomycetota bacterium]|nr:MAG: hypothetical protein DCC67_20570 [Planctomycetota bacterium]